MTRTPRQGDPMERIIEEALIEAGVSFTPERSGGAAHRLDFHLPDIDLAIEVKRFHSPRAAEQLARFPNIVLAQGEVAVRALAAMIRSGGLTAVAAAPPPKGREGA